MLQGLWVVHILSVKSLKYSPLPCNIVYVACRNLEAHHAALYFDTRNSKVTRHPPAWTQFIRRFQVLEVPKAIAQLYLIPKVRFAVRVLLSSRHSIPLSKFDIFPLLPSSIDRHNNPPSAPCKR